MSLLGFAGAITRHRGPQQSKNPGFEAGDGIPGE